MLQVGLLVAIEVSAVGQLPRSIADIKGDTEIILIDEDTNKRRFEVCGESGRCWTPSGCPPLFFGTWEPKGSHRVWDIGGQGGDGRGFIVQRDGFAEGMVYCGGRVFWVTGISDKQIGRRWHEIEEQAPIEPLRNISWKVVELEEVVADDRFSGHPAEDLREDWFFRVDRSESSTLEQGVATLMQHHDGAIKILLVYSADVVNKLSPGGSDPAAEEVDFFTIVLDELTDWTFRESGVDVQVDLETYRHAPKIASGSLKAARDDFREYRRSSSKGMPLFLDQAQVDAIAFIGEFGSAQEAPCGFTPCGGACASRHENLMFVDWRCAKKKLAFVHELGHLLGATHESKESSCPFTSFSAGRGYCSPKGWCTIMGSRKGIQAPSPPQYLRLLFWSDRHKTYLGERPAGGCVDNVSILEVGAKLLSLTRISRATGLSTCLDQALLGKQIGMCH